MKTNNNQNNLGRNHKKYRRLTSMMFLIQIKRDKKNYQVIKVAARKVVVENLEIHLKLILKEKKIQ